MIINPLSVAALTVDGFSLGLAAATTAGTMYMLPALRNSSSIATGERLTLLENRLYLLFWMGAVLLILRFAAWPLFYFTLHSFVPEIEGAMCIFGARNLLPTLTRTMEVIKPLLFFLGLIWLILFRFERFASRQDQVKQFTRQGQGRVLFLLLLCSLAALADSGGTVLLWLQSNAELAVSCCTTVTDIPDRFTVWMPKSIFGPAYSMLLWYLFFGANLLLIFQIILSYRKSLLAAVPTLHLLFLFVFGLLNGVIGLFAFIEVIAPRLMGLPFHHCIYCMVQTVVDGPLMLALFAVGNFAVAACLPITLLARNWTEDEPLNKGIRLLLYIGLLGVSGSTIMVAAHLLAEKIG